MKKMLSLLSSKDTSKQAASTTPSATQQAPKQTAEQAVEERTQPEPAEQAVEQAAGRLQYAADNPVQRLQQAGQLGEQRVHQTLDGAYM